MGGLPDDSFCPIFGVMVTFMKVLIADRLQDFVQTQLADSGCEVIVNPALRDDALRDAIAETGADVVVVRSTVVTGPMLEAGRVKLVIRAGAGYNTIDVTTAKRLGILVANCPGMNAQAVAEIAFGLMLSLDRRIHDNVRDLREGRWNKLGYSTANGLYGSTLGLIGLGIIGKAMIPRAKAFGMPVVAWSRSLTPEIASSLGVEMAASPIEVASKADVVSLHVALTDDTRHMADGDFFDAMKPGAMLINTARAEVVDEAALMRAVLEKGIRVGVDVFENEPTTDTGEVHNPMFQLEGVIGTHHIGGQTRQAQLAVSHEVVHIIREYLSTGTPPNLVV
jgi:D-3-phosphoglycerate dehydrogenase